MSRRSVFLTISVLAFVASIGVFLRGQYLDWEAARMEFMSEHVDAPTIDVAPKRNGWLLEGPTEQFERSANGEFETAAKWNAAGHHRTMAMILAGAGLVAGYWAWAKCRPQFPAADVS